MNESSKYTSNQLTKLDSRIRTLQYSEIMLPISIHLEHRLGAHLERHMHC